MLRNLLLLKDILLDFIKSLTDFLFPQSRKVLELEALSSSDLLRLLPSADHLSDKDLVALFAYDKPLVREIVWEVKYGGNAILSDRLGEILYDVIIDELTERNVVAKFPTVILMPMPISGKRRNERGWNQAELLTNAIKKRDLGDVFKYLPTQLVKSFHTESQTKTADRAERKRNLLNSMRVLNPLSVEGKFVVLVDDVLTTGSTFAEAKRALKLAGAKRIMCVAIAH